MEKGKSTNEKKSQRTLRPVFAVSPFFRLLELQGVTGGAEGREVKGEGGQGGSTGTQWALAAFIFVEECGGSLERTSKNLLEPFCNTRTPLTSTAATPCVFRGGGVSRASPKSIVKTASSARLEFSVRFEIPFIFFLDLH